MQRIHLHVLDIYITGTCALSDIYVHTCPRVLHALRRHVYVLYSGNVWQEETLANFSE